MHSLFTRWFDESRSVLLVSSDDFICSIVEDALYEWRYSVHVVSDPTRAIQELHLHHFRVVILDLESLDLLDRELREMITQGLAENGIRVIHIEPSCFLRATGFRRSRPHALLTKPFDCTLLRKSLEPGWQPPRPAVPSTSIPATLDRPASDRKLLKMSDAIRAQADSFNSQHRIDRKPSGACRKTLGFKKRSA